MNTTDDTELQAAAQKLTEQKPLVQQYVMDEIFDLMENEEKNGFFRYNLDLF